jgi:biotin-dependent carboxylase-like uncharacterized protein
MIHVDTPGLRATVQDAGRFGHLREGVPHSGPADPFAFRAAQALVGNSPDAAAIEIVGLPFAFRCDDTRLVAVSGREVGLRARDDLPGWMSVLVRGGQRVTIHGTERTRFAYLAVSGGIASPEELGSRSAYPPAGLGRVLRGGDALPLGAPEREAPAGRRIGFAYEGEVGAVPGPHLERFADAAVSAFFAATFRVAAQSDRQGVRLEGPPIPPREGEVLTCGVVAGAVQVPRGGQPIVLLADHQTTGGYPIVATVIGPDLGRVAQAAPGEELRFVRVTREVALGREAERRALLNSWRAP